MAVKLKVVIAPGLSLLNDFVVLTLPAAPVDLCCESGIAAWQ